MCNLDDVYTGKGCPTHSFLMLSYFSLIDLAELQTTHTLLLKSSRR